MAGVGHPPLRMANDCLSPVDLIRDFGPEPES